MKRAFLPLSIALLLSPLVSKAGDSSASATVDLSGVVFENGKTARVTSGTQVLPASPIYQYAITGTVTGYGAFNFIHPGSDIGDALDAIQPGISKNLAGGVLNPSGKLPFVAINSKVRNSNFLGAKVRASLQASISKSGQALFSLTDVSALLAGFPLPNSRIVFDSGSTLQISVPEGSGTAAQPDLAADAGSGGLVPDSEIDGVVGSNIYNVTGEGQRVVRVLPKKGKVTFNLLVQNDASQTDTLHLLGPKGNSDVVITYKLGRKDVTKQVTSVGGLTLSDLPSLGGKVVNVTVTAKKERASFSGLISATGSTDSKDVVAVVLNPVIIEHN